MNPEPVLNPEATPPLRLSERIAQWEELADQEPDFIRRRAQAQAVVDECDAALVNVTLGRKMITLAERVLGEAQSPIPATSELRFAVIDLRPDAGVDSTSSPAEDPVNEPTVVVDVPPAPEEIAPPAEPEDEAPAAPEDPEEAAPTQDTPPPAEDPAAPADEPEPNIVQPEPAIQAAPDAPVQDAAPADPPTPPPAPEPTTPRPARPASSALAREPERQQPPYREAPAIPVTENERQSVLGVLREHRRMMSESMVLNRLRPLKMPRLRIILNDLLADDLVKSADGGQRWGIV